MGLNNAQYEAVADQIESIESILKDPEGATTLIKHEKTRRRLVEGGRKLAVSLEQPGDTFRRIGYSVSRIELSVREFSD